MSVVAVCGAAGSSVSTTTGLVLAASVPARQPAVFAECDPSGGDVAAWAELRETPGWATAVAAGDRSWNGLRTHLQQLPSGLSVLLAPTRGSVARTVVREAATRFGPLLRSMPDVVTFADCGRVTGEVPVWAMSASLVLLTVRQAATSAGATAARVDRSPAVVARSRPTASKSPAWKLSSAAASALAARRAGSCDSATARCRKAAAAATPPRA